MISILSIMPVHRNTLYSYITQEFIMLNTGNNTVKGKKAVGQNIAQIWKGGYILGENLLIKEVDNANSCQ